MNNSRHFRIEHDGEILFLDLQRPVGSLSDAEIHEELELVLADLEQSRPQAVVVDFEQVSYFGSMMLEALRVIWNRLEKMGARFALCNVSPVGREILELARFDTLWPICDSRDEAREVVRRKK